MDKETKEVKEVKEPKAKGLDLSQVSRVEIENSINKEKNYMYQLLDADGLPDKDMKVETYLNDKGQTLKITITK